MIDTHATKKELPEEVRKLLDVSNWYVNKATKSKAEPTPSSHEGTIEDQQYDCGGRKSARELRLQAMATPPLSHRSQNKVSKGLLLVSGSNSQIVGRGRSNSPVSPAKKGGSDISNPVIEQVLLSDLVVGVEELKDPEELRLQEIEERKIA